MVSCSGVVEFFFFFLGSFFDRTGFIDARKFELFFRFYIKVPAQEEVSVLDIELPILLLILLCCRLLLNLAFRWVPFDELLA